MQNDVVRFGTCDDDDADDENDLLLQI